MSVCLYVCMSVCLYVCMSQLIGTNKRERGVPRVSTYGISNLVSQYFQRILLRVLLYRTRTYVRI